MAHGPLAATAIELSESPELPDLDPDPVLESVSEKTDDAKNYDVDDLVVLLVQKKMMEMMQKIIILVLTKLDLMMQAARLPLPRRCLLASWLYALLCLHPE